MTQQAPDAVVGDIVEMDGLRCLARAPPPLSTHQFRCQSNGLHHARRIGFALPGDVKGRAVVHRRADNRQAERQGYAVFEGVGLYRDVPLIVVHLWVLVLVLT